MIDRILIRSTPGRAPAVPIPFARLGALLARGVALALVLLLAALTLPVAPAHAAGSSIALGASRVAVGDTLTVDYATDAPDTTNWIAIYRAEDGTPDGSPASRAYQYAPDVAGTVTFTISGSRLVPGEYLVYFLALDGYTQLVEPAALTIVEAGAVEPVASTLSLAASSARVGESIQVSYTTGAPSNTNWIGIYRLADGTPDGDPGSRVWSYAPGTSGTVELALASGVFTAGEYRVFFLANDGYQQLAEPLALTVLPEPASLAALVAEYRSADARVGDPFRVTVSALFHTTGAEEPSFTLEGAPAWLTVQGGVASGTPDAAGAASVTVLARLGELTARAELTIPVVPAGASLGDELTIVSYNAWHQGAQVADGRMKEIRTFLEQGADVVALQESSSAHASELAALLGWSWYGDGGDTTVISRYPLAETVASSAADGVRVVVDAEQNRSVWVLSAHLGYARYGPYYAQEGRSVEYILSEENVQRGPQVRDNIETMAQLAQDYPGVPIVYAGDLNTPSHLDWTEANRDQHGGLVVPWPVSTELHAAGFVDSYRTVHPDPVADPATSWTPRFLDEPQDRIDFIYLKGEALRITDSRYFHGASMDEWASDHGSFATVFRWVSEDDAGETLPGTGVTTPDAGAPSVRQLAATGTDASPAWAFGLLLGGLLALAIARFSVRRRRV
ncbi:MAG: endonuclease/exonuclease/phosphatase family protein [Microbacteriaceae bacterium]|nr:MAG: endonuclease/exonuclease/phosphatase family protein [Microbacteriaceae bacterium]